MVVILTQNMRQTEMSEDNKKFRTALINMRYAACTNSVLKSSLVQSLGPKMGNRQPQLQSLVAYFGATTTELLKTGLTWFSCLKKLVLTSFNQFFVHFYKILLIYNK